MKPVNSGRWTVNREHAEQGAAQLSTNHYSLSTVLVVGYGNPLRSDDGLGWHASRLVAEAFGSHDVEVITCHQLTPELAEPLSQCRRAVFIDADSQSRPGEIHSRRVHPQSIESSPFTHTCTPAGLLASAQQLYGHHPEAITITVSAQSFDFGESLSPVVSATLPKVVEKIRKWLGTEKFSHNP